MVVRSGDGCASVGMSGRGPVHGSSSPRLRQLDARATIPHDGSVVGRVHASTQPFTTCHPTSAWRERLIALPERATAVDESAAP